MGRQGCKTVINFSRKNIRWRDITDLKINLHEYQAYKYTFQPADFLILASLGAKNATYGMWKVLFQPPDSVYVDVDFLEDWEEICKTLGVTIYTEDQIDKIIGWTKQK